MLWPTDGHPASMAAVLAHPGQIASVAVSCDGRKLLTASRDGHVNQWSINGLALRARSEAVGSGPKRWQTVLGSDISFEEVQRHVAVPLPTLFSVAACQSGVGMVYMLHCAHCMNVQTTRQECMQLFPSEPSSSCWRQHICAKGGHGQSAIGKHSGGDVCPGILSFTISSY